MRATEIAHLLAQRAESVCRHLLPLGRNDGDYWRVGSVNGEPGDSLTVHLQGARVGVWVDWAGTEDDRGDLIGLWMRVRNVSLGQACKDALDWLAVPHAQRNTRVEIARKPKAPRAPDQRWIDMQGTLRAGTIPELRALADLRKLPCIAGLELATRAGHLFFTDVHDNGERHPAWLVTDASRKNAQARKTDGSLWVFGPKRKPSKSKTIWGSDPHWPIGAAVIDTPEVMLVEGAPDLLAAWTLIHLTGRASQIAPVAMLGASNDIDASALQAFAGKEVWIFPHADAAGQRSLERWAGQLLPNAACIRPVRTKHKDVNDFVSATYR